MDKKDRKLFITNLVEIHLPELATMAKDSETEGVLLHQDAFAADYQEEELLLLGAAIKYIGMTSDKQITIIGKDQETLN